MTSTTTSAKPRTISAAEFGRRRHLLSAHMREHGLDAIVAVGTDNFLSGALRWLTNAPVAYRRVVIFYPDALMTVIEHGGWGDRRETDGNSPDYPGVGEVIGVPEFPSAHYGQEYESTLALAAIKRRGCKTIGLLNPGGMPYAFLSALKAGLDAEFSDESDAVDMMRAIKSDEEIVLLRQAAELQDTVFERTLARITPGMTGADLAGFIHQQARSLGGEAGFIAVGSGPLGTMVPFQMDHKQGRVICAGDYLSILVETCGPEGYYTELSRTVVLGRATDELHASFDEAKRAQRYALDQCRPGTLCSTIYARQSEYLATRNLPPERRLFAHGQGFDMVERPLIRDDETMEVRENMCLVVHPSVVTPTCFMTLTDNYIVGAEGPGESIHRTAQKIFEI